MRVVIADGHPATRFGIKQLLDTATGVRVVGESGDGAEALRLVEEARPDLVILDLALRGGTSGIETCRKIKDFSSPPRVLVHTDRNAAEDLAAVAIAGADGYLHKGVEHVGLQEAAKRIVTGERMWVVSSEPEVVGSSLLVETSGCTRLTPKEREVLALMLRRYTNHEIAARLYISLQTAKNLTSSVLRKLGFKSRKDLFGAGRCERAARSA